MTNLESRISSGGIENLVNSKEVSREGFGTVYEMIKKLRGTKTKRYYLILLDDGYCYEEELREDVREFEILPRIQDLNHYLNFAGLYLANARLHPELGSKVNFSSSDKTAYCLGTGDVYIKKQKEAGSEYPSEKVIVPDFLPEEFG
jgi:hypothetical protein